MDKKAKKYSLNELIEKVDALRKHDDFDLSTEQDLVIGIMNLISIEEHLAFTYNKTGKTKYLTMLQEVREMRKTLLKQVIKEYEGEVWCTCKHLLSTSMRLMEVGTKQLGAGRLKESEEFFQKSYDAYCMFWALVLDIGGSEKTDIVQDRVKNLDHALIGDVIDCCKE